MELDEGIVLRGAAGTVPVKVKARVDENGLLEVSASFGGMTVQSQFDRNVARLGEENVENALKRAVVCAREEKGKKARLDAMANFKHEVEIVKYRASKVIFLLISDRNEFNNYRQRIMKERD